MLIHLKSVAKDMGLENKFSVREPTNQCVCLDKNNETWEVYVIENGKSFEKNYFEDCFDTCIEVINLLADRKQMYEEPKKDLTKFARIKKLV